MSSDVFKLKQGKDQSVVFTFNGINLTGSTVFFTAKKAIDADADDSEAAITIDQATHTDAVNGITTLDFTAAKTSVSPGWYLWDTQIKDSGGDLSGTFTGRLLIDGSVTQRTS